MSTRTHEEAETTDKNDWGSLAGGALYKNVVTQRTITPTISKMPAANAAAANAYAAAADSNGHGNGRKIESTIFHEIKPIAEEIVKEVNTCEILDENHTLRLEVTAPPNGIYVKFTIDDSSKGEVANASAVFDRESTKDYTKDGSEQGIYSSIGNKTGQLLFNLLLLVVIRANIEDFKLDNFTGEPARAAEGIYKRLGVDTRGSVAIDFVGLSLDKQLLVSEGKMRYKLTSDSMTNWVTDMRQLGSGGCRTSPPWNKLVDTNMTRLTNRLKQTQGGNRKPKPKRKSKRKKRTRRTRRRKRTKTRRRRKK